MPAPRNGECAGVITKLELTCLVLILAVGGWLRFSQLGLVEFKGDEAIAAQLALNFVQNGELPRAGLMSSVGVTNPPLFPYLLIPAFALTRDIAVVTGFIGLTGMAAVVMTWWIGRTYYSRAAGLVAAAFFATSPWAVIYSRKIWAQDFVPIFAAGTLWALHALCLGPKPRAIFWALLIPLCVAQIHFSGFALLAGVVVLLVVLRPKTAWTWAGLAGAAALIPLLPYLALQHQTGWGDFRRAAATIGSHEFNLPPSLTVHPDSGYVLPGRTPWAQAMAVLGHGRIEDILGLSTRRELDPNGVWPHDYFEATLTFGDLPASTLAVASLVALGWLSIRSLRTVTDRRYFIFVLWITVPVAVFLVTRLGTYSSYFLIFYPANFLALGLAAEQLRARAPRATLIAVGLLLTINVVFVTDLYCFLQTHRGAHGTYGTILADKEAAARFLAGRGDVNQLMKEGRLWQIDRLVTVGEGHKVALAERAQPDLDFLAAAHTSSERFPDSQLVFVVDQNRVSFEPEAWLRHRTMFAAPEGNRMRLHELSWNHAAPLAQSRFGPLWLFVVER